MAGKPTTGIRQRHGNRGKGCDRCGCPWEASVYSKRDEKKIRKTFPSKAAAAAVAWRDDAKPQVRRNEVRAPAPTTLQQAADKWLEDARSGVIRNRSGDLCRPSAIRTTSRACGCGYCRISVA